MFLVVATLGRLQIEPRVRERLDVWQQRLNERMKFILDTEQSQALAIINTTRAVIKTQV